MYFPNFKVRKGLEGPAKDGETITLEQIETDDENDEVRVKSDDVSNVSIMSQVEYEAWKLREMKRLKRDREEAEAVAKEQAELERLRNLTEEERRLAMSPATFIVSVSRNLSACSYHLIEKYLSSHPLQDGAAEEPEGSDEQGGQGEIQIPTEILSQV